MEFYKRVNIMWHYCSRGTYLRKSTRLVGEDVLYATQVIRQVPAFADGSLARLFVHYICVEIDECSLQSSDEFD